MKATQEELNAMFKKGFANEPLIKMVCMAGCYDCTEIFPTQEIKHWADDRPFRTAFCPRCGNDSVVPDSSEYPLCKDFLRQMRSEFFLGSELLDGIDFSVFKTTQELHAALDGLGVKYRVIKKSRGASRNGTLIPFLAPAMQHGHIHLS